MRLLTSRGALLADADAVLRAGLETASWLSVDDTGARHQAAKGMCTQAGDDRFTAFKTTASKSRLNFLELLRAGHGDYVVNAAALTYMRQRGVPLGAVAQLEAHPSTGSVMKRSTASICAALLVAACAQDAPGVETHLIDDPGSRQREASGP